MKRTKRINYHLLGVYIVLTLYTLYTLYPIFLMLATALKGNLEIMQNPVGLPHQIVLDGFRTLFERENFGQYFLNSIFVSVVSSVILMVISLMLAYVLCRYTSKLSNFLYFFFRSVCPDLITQMLPFLHTLLRFLLQTFFQRKKLLCSIYVIMAEQLCLFGNGIQF